MEQKEKSRQSIEFIINCAINEFAEKGTNFSLNTVCKKYGISKGKLYHHFESKDQILCSCVCYSLKQLINNINSYEINENVSIKQNFHDYYYERILHWQENYNHLTILRYAYNISASFFSEEALTEIIKYKDLWKQAKRDKTLAILHSNNNELRIDDDSIAEIILIMYENTFQILENKMIRAVKKDDKEEIDKTTKDLIDYHDAIIDMILYGALKK